MITKWIGATLIIIVCGGFGFHLSAAQKKEAFILQQLMFMLEYIRCELQYHLTPLPQLCRQASDHASGVVSAIFRNLSEELEKQVSPNAEICMAAVLNRMDAVPESVLELLQRLGKTLGSFDLHGQQKELENIYSSCRSRMERSSENLEIRHRSYKTLGLCAGAALAILLI